MKPVFGSFKVLVCGSLPGCSSQILSFVRSLGEQIANTPDLVLLTGGHRTNKSGGDTSDYTAALAARQALSKAGIPERNRIITMLPHSDPIPGKRFRIGNVIEVGRSDSKSRRFSMVMACNGVIALDGGRPTSDMVDLAWVSGKAVLPIPFTGGAARKKWKQYNDELVATFGITDKEEEELLDIGSGSPETKAALCLALLRRKLRARCFVAMPYGDHPHPEAFATIERVVNELGYTAVRLDRATFTGSVLDAIREAIESAEVVLVDLSGYNPNVLYELGMAQALGKRTVLLIFSKTGEAPPDMPFDVSVQRVHPFTAENLSETLFEVLDK